LGVKQALTHQQRSVNVALSTTSFRLNGKRVLRNHRFFSSLLGDKPWGCTGAAVR
jgi:hypothetical protein